LEVIAKMYMLSKQRFLIETPPDEGLRRTAGFTPMLLSW
jgi:hypothetical protein